MAYICYSLHEEFALIQTEADLVISEYFTDIFEIDQDQLFIAAP